MYFSWGEKEREAVKTLREKAGEWATEQHSDWYLGRFLIARKWSMDAALELFVNAMKWRKEENIDSLVETFPDDFCSISWHRIGQLLFLPIERTPLRTGVPLFTSELD